MIVVGAISIVALALGLALMVSVVRIRRLSARLEFSAQRMAQLVHRNRELTEQKGELQRKHDAYRQSRSAAVAKGNRTRAAKARRDSASAGGVA